MAPDDSPVSGPASAGDRLARLSRASLRINASLDVDAALQAVMDGARDLTRAPYAAIVTLDASGRVEEHLVLGWDPGDVERLWQAPEGEVFFEYLNARPGPLRIGHLEAFTASIGFGEFRSPVKLTAFMAAPILHQGARAGNLYVGSDEAGRTFTQDDEETLVLFAAQAAQVIANARRHREEQRARAGLETLIDTSPVGVVVLDARTGATVSRRILLLSLPVSNLASASPLQGSPAPSAGRVAAFAGSWFQLFVCRALPERPRATCRRMPPVWAVSAASPERQRTRWSTCHCPTASPGR